MVVLHFSDPSLPLTSLQRQYCINYTALYCIFWPWLNESDKPDHTHLHEKGFGNYRQIYWLEMEISNQIAKWPINVMGTRFCIKKLPDAPPLKGGGQLGDSDWPVCHHCQWLSLECLWTEAVGLAGSAGPLQELLQSAPPQLAFLPVKPTTIPHQSGGVSPSPTGAPLPLLHWRGAGCSKNIGKNLLPFIRCLCESCSTDINKSPTTS